MEHLNAPEAPYEDDGSVWIYYYGGEAGHHPSVQYA